MHHDSFLQAVGEWEGLCARRAEMLVEVAKTITDISIFEVVSVATEGYVKDNLEGIYFHTYKTYGKSRVLEKKFGAVQDELWNIIISTKMNRYPEGNAITPLTAHYGFYFWRRFKSLPSA